MRLAYRKQKFQDWFTQQWVILWGKKINAEDYPWLMGPFGNLTGIGEDFIQQLATKENLTIQRNNQTRGLIPSIDMLHLSQSELTNLSQEVIRFYEKTALYNLHFSVKWNPFFKGFGILVNKLFSKRINQLNVPTRNTKNAENIKSEIITLTDPASGTIKYTIWFRSFISTGKVIYSGIYSTCTLPSGKTCVKAVFPLPKGNATVIMLPCVGLNGELILNSAGKKIGDAGFYFLLNDSKGKYWAQFIRSFRDQLIIGVVNDELTAEQTLTLWGKKVLQFKYAINLKK